MSDTISRAQSAGGVEHTHGSTLLQADGLSKSYGPVRALNDVGIRIGSGEIHALVGENGSGKSTLVGIVSGTVVKDAGELSIGGVDVRGVGPRESQRLGAVTVFQDGSLIPELTVGQNLYLGSPADDRPGFAQINSWALAMLTAYGFDIDPSLLASDLPPGDRQLIEIVRAVASKPTILVLDEATSALDSRGVDIVLDLMRDVAASGSAVLFVTHRLSEVMRVAHTVTVLRDGRSQGTHQASKISTAGLVELMAGTRVELEFPKRADTSRDLVQQLSGRGLGGAGFGPIDIDLDAGEIVGIAGADGNGQLPLLRSLARLSGETAGSVRVGDSDIDSYREAVAHGVVYLSSDRRAESLFGGLTIGGNLGIGALPELSDKGLMKTRLESSFVAQLIDKYRIKIGHAGQSPLELSGGNQQKVALSRVLAMHPRVVLIDEPTQGVDVRSRLDIYRFLREIAESGSTVVIVSSDASELAGLCDRILVMSRGQLTTELTGEGSTEESIVSAFAVEHELAATTEGEFALEDETLPPAAAVRRGFLRGLSADWVRAAALVVLLVVLSVFAQGKNDTFLSTLSLFNLMLLALPLIAVAAAQYFVLMVGGIDVSVGSTMTLAVVLSSFWMQHGSAVSVVVIATAVIVFCAITVGGTNALLVERVGLSPVIATIATLGIAAGAALMLRPTAGGLIAPKLSEIVQSRVGPMPYSLIVLIIGLVLVDVLFRRTGWGLRVRAVGLNGLFAQRLGIAARRVRVLGYVLCSGLAGLAGIILAAQVGIGDPSAGSSFTLMAIAAPVLGGAALSGGHGSLVGAALGAFILVISQSLVIVLGMSDGSSYLFTGTLTLLALLSSAERLQRAGRLFRRTAK